MSLISDAQKRLGEIFIFGIEGKTLSDDSAAFISQAGIGGIIYFSKNFESVEQIANLSNQILECRGDLPLWISVDQEGGRVQRFKTPFSILPPALKVGESNSTKLIFEIYEMAAKELRAVGVNLNFAPVTDVLTNPNNPVIGDRAYGRDEEAVSHTVTAVVRGLLMGGVQPCAKHFPGHGDTDKDSHFDLPRVNTPLETLREREFRPFVKVFKSRCNFVLTCHVMNPNLDPDFPATLSQKTLQDILRTELRFSKIIVSDDMEMKAITDHFGADQAPILALTAGCDLLVYRSEGAARHAYEVLYKAIESNKLNPERVLEAAERSRALKREVLADFKPVDPFEAKKIVGCAEHQALIQKLSS